MPTYKVEGENEAYLCRMQKLMSKAEKRKVSKTEVLNIILETARNQEVESGDTVSFTEKDIRPRNPHT